MITIPPVARDPRIQCRPATAEAFWPAQGESPAPGKAICAPCPARRACLRWAIQHDVRGGIWGGLTGQERHALVRKGAAA